MTVAENVAQYVIFEDRVVFISEGKLFFKRLTDAEPTFVLPDVDSIGSVTSDAIFATRFTSTGVYEALFQVLRVSWFGEAETLYQTRFVTYHVVFNSAVAAAKGITYVAQTMSYATTLLAIQDGFVSERFRATGPIWILAANEHAITFADWGLSTGMHDVVELECAGPLRTRAVR